MGRQKRRPAEAGLPGQEASPEPLELSEEGIAEPSLARRIGGTSLWVLIAIAAAASRLCAED
jgi:hypothetical protein